MTTSVVTGGAGFLGSHLCDYLLAQGTGSSASTTSRQARSRTSSTSATTGVHVRQPGRRRRHLDRRAGRLRLPSREPRQPDRLPAPAAADAEGRLAGHAQRARPRQVEARALPDQLDERGLRRPAGASAARDLLGQREPDRPARRLRRGQALRRGAHDGVPQPAGRRHRDRAHLQHLRPADEAERRPRDGHLPAPGARGEAAHGLRRRVADAVALLRRRPDPRAAPARDCPTSTCRSTSATPTTR